MKRRAALAITAILMMSPDLAIAETELLPLPKITIRFATGTPQGIGLKVTVEVEVNQLESVRDNKGVLQDVVFLAGYDFLVSARRMAPQAPSTTILKERIELETERRLGRHTKIKAHLQELSFQ
jgi:hypothetical protein